MNNNPFINVNELGKGFDFSPWGGIEGFLRAAKSGQLGNATALKRMVPDLARAVDMTAVAISSLPFEIQDEGGKATDSSEDWKNEIGGMENPKRMIYLLASSLCGGSAYLIPTRTTKMIFDLQYAAPHTIAPQIRREGLQYFDRANDQGQTDRFTPKELIYFWLPDSDIEIGPAENHPLGNAALASQLIFNMDNTMKMYGERGFVPITLLGAKGMPNDSERKKAEGFFDRLLRGGFDQLAKIINSEALSLIKVGAGLEEMKGSYQEIRRLAKESIADAFGIPSALFMSDNAFASEFDALRLHWYTASRFVGIYQTIEEVMTEQLLKAYGKKMKFTPENMDVFQEDEEQRNSSLSTFVSSVDKNPEIAKLGMDILGYDLTKEQQAHLDKIISDKEADKEAAREAMQNQPNEEGEEGEQEQSMPADNKTPFKPTKANENSAMIALRIPDAIKKEIANQYSFVDQETLNELHITLVYIGDNRTLDKSDAIRAVSDLGMYQAPIKGKLQGLARFVNGTEKDPLVVTFDSPQMPRVYKMLCDILDNYKIPYHRDHGFIPHMTLAYIGKNEEMPIDTIEPIEINFADVYLVDGNVWLPVELIGYENKTIAKQPDLTADEISDLALWYSKAKTWHAKNKGTAADWENKHLREDVAAPIREKLKTAKNEQEITAAFQVGQPAPVDSVMVLAMQIEKAIAAING